MHPIAMQAVGVFLATAMSVAGTITGPIIGDSQEEPSPICIELQAFLETKNSPLPAEELVKYDNWPMIVAVSVAESGYGKNTAGAYNAWGIKDFRNGSQKFGKTRDFVSWGESIKYASELLYKYDTDDGQPKPEAMVARWKYIQPFDGWLRNVRSGIWQLKKNVPTAIDVIKV